VSRRVGLPLVVTLKVLVIGLTALGALGGLERFEEKGFGWRLLWYRSRCSHCRSLWKVLKKQGPYPYLADALITFPFFVDVMGNVTNLYDTIGWWDDVNHFANWFFLSMGVGALLLRTRFSRSRHGLRAASARRSRSSGSWRVPDVHPTNEDEFAALHTHWRPHVRPRRRCSLLGPRTTPRAVAIGVAAARDRHVAAASCDLDPRSRRRVGSPACRAPPPRSPRSTRRGPPPS
jgi:hypothetical protein